MNKHISILLEHIRNSINLYELGKISEHELELNLTGNVDAIEDEKIKNILNIFINKIEESLFLFDKNDGKKFLLQEIKKLRKEIKQLD